MKKVNLLILFVMFHFILTDYLLSQSKEWELVGWATSPVTMNLARIRCADSLNCMIWGDIELGWGHYFRRTKDGGQSWKDVYLDSSYQDVFKKFHMITQINAIEYPSPNLFIAAGDSGMILKTTNQGKTWQKTFVDKTKSFLDIRMLDDKFGIIICYAELLKKKEMLATTDGGLSWTKMNMPDGFDSTQIIDYQILDSNLSVFLFRKYNEDTKILWVHGNWEQWYTYPASNNCWFLNFVNEDKGWMCGGSKINNLNNTQLIMHTEDGGKTWVTQRDEKVNGYSLRGIKFFNDSHGMATGGYATVLTTYNGGKCWRMDTIRKLQENGGDPCVLGSPQIPSITTAFVIAGARWIYKYTRDWALGAEDNNEEQETGSLVTLGQNSPNPFSGRTEISYTLSKYSHVKLAVYDMFGIMRQPLIDEYEGAGGHSVVFTLEGLPQGTYFYRLETESGSVARQMVLIR